MARPRSGNKQKKIVQAALKSFFERGVAKTTMQYVADEAGIAVGTLYLYYKDKDDLVSSCAEFFEDEHLHDADVFCRGNSPSKDLLIAYHMKRYSEWQKLISITPGSRELVLAILKLRPDKVEEYKVLTLKTTERLILRGIERGEFSVTSAQQTSLNIFIALSPFFLLSNEKTLFVAETNYFENFLLWLIEQALS